MVVLDNQHTVSALINKNRNLINDYLTIPTKAHIYSASNWK